MARKTTSKQSQDGQAYEQLLQACLSLGPEHDLTHLDALKKNVSHLSQDLHKQVESFKQKISKMPLSAFVILWADFILDGKVSGSHQLKMMCELIEAKLLTLTSLEKFARLDPPFIIERIRCFADWTLSKREAVVHFYHLFATWLSKETFDYTSQAKDLDRIASQKRLVPFDTYIKILSHLDLREQIIAKMFYLGGQRGLDEVLSVRIEDIDFNQALIRFFEEVSYPRHLFNDIEIYAQNRKKGFLFLGKDGERISHTTPFRALKKVVSNLKLDPEFTFRELTRNL